MSLSLHRERYGRRPARAGRAAAAEAAEGLPRAPELTPTVLVVDDDQTICGQLERLYASDGYNVLTAGSAEEALGKLEEGVVDFVISDIRLPGMSGAELIAHIRQRHPDLPVMAITGYSDIETAVNVLKGGAVDFVLKPFNLATVQESTRAALEKSRVYMEIRHLRRALRNAPEFGGILSKTPEMHRVFETIRMVAPTDEVMSRGV